MSTNDKRKDREPDTKDNEPSRANKPSLSDYMNVVVAVCAVVGIVFLGIQYRYMAAGAREAKVASEDSTKITAKAMKLLEQIERSQNKSASAASEAIRRNAEQFDLQQERAAEVAREERARFVAALGQQQRDAAAEQDLTRQSNEMTRKSNSVAAEGMRIARLVYMDDHRPLIKALAAEAEITETTVVARVRFKNRGKVAGEEILFDGGIAIQDENFDPFTQTAPARSSLFGNLMTINLEPGQETIFTIAPIFKRITPTEIEQVTKGELSLFVYGYFHPWLDPFKSRSEHVYFCYRLHFYQGRYYGRTAGPGTYQLEAWNENNSMEYDKTGADETMTWREDSKDPTNNRMTVPFAPDWPALPNPPPEL